MPERIKENLQTKNLERRFYLWTMRNDFDVASSKVTKPSEIIIKIDAESLAKQKKSYESLPESDRSGKIGKTNNSITYLLIILLFSGVTGIFVYQYLSSKQLEINPYVPNISTSTGRIDDGFVNKPIFPTGLISTSSTSTVNLNKQSTSTIVSTTTINNNSTSSKIITTSTNTTTPTSTLSNSINKNNTTSSTSTIAQDNLSTSTIKTTSTSTEIQVKYAISLIPADKVEVVQIDSLNQIWDKIQEYVAKDYQSERLIRLVFIVNDELGKREPSLDEFIGGFGFSIPSNIKAKLDPKIYNYFIFTQKENFGTPKISNKRSVLLLKTKGNSEIYSLISQWESFILSDLVPRFFLKITPQSSYSKIFQDSQYQYKENTMTFRFMNFPEPDISIDYVLDKVRNLLLLTTSRESAWYTEDLIRKYQQTQ